MRTKKSFLFALWSAALLLCAAVSLFALLFSACAGPAAAKETDPGGFTVQNPEASIQNVQRKAYNKVRELQRRFPGNKEAYLKTKETIRSLGVTPQTTYLYIQGHHLFDNVVVPILNKVCNRLRQERQDEIARTARHHMQKRNEMSCYEHSLQDIRQTLKKNTGYQLSPLFQRIQQDVEAYLTKGRTSQGT